MRCWRTLSIQRTATFHRAPRPDSGSNSGRISWNSTESDEKVKYRHHRTGLNGQSSLQRLPSGQSLLRNAVRAAVESDLRPEPGGPGEDGGHLGLGGDLD